MSEPTTVTKTAPELIWLQHSDDVLDVDLPFPDEHDGISWCHEQVFMGDVEYIRKDLYAALKRQRDMLLEAVKKYADRQNWGYYDDSGCDKGHGEYTDACFIGPEVAQAAIAAVEGEK